ncbi:DUF3501 family protein [Aromatoleum aromaticum]|uniref:DUF3501 family protein n=1 Tax=Aromatoleum aromaticum TaxID=551760 RepID=UPI00067469C2|nr:DUF3501 family protein [Aromatoleum aromaticum]NMG56398.1 DUF3501 family protein [Aromatoleum aromaticum]
MRLVFAFSIADDGPERDNAEKTSVLHFLRFQLPPDTIRSLKAGGACAIGIDQPAPSAAVDTLPERIRLFLCGDLQA